MRSGNPALKDNAFTRSRTDGASMTLEGAVNRTILLLALLAGVAGYIWWRFGKVVQTRDEETLVTLCMIAGFCLVGGFLVAMATIFKPSWSPFTAPLYAILEGTVIGSVSMFYEADYPGIVIQAAGLVIAILFGLLLAYRTGKIRATENFKLGVIAATLGIAGVYLASIALGLFGLDIPLIHESGWVGIGFSLFVVVIASLNLVLDFDFIAKNVAAGASRHMEWYAAFGLLVTLVWLFMEVLRLLAKLRGSD